MTDHITDLYDDTTNGHDTSPQDKEKSDGGFSREYWLEYDILLGNARIRGTWAEIVFRKDGQYHVHGYVPGHGIVDSAPTSDRLSTLRAFITTYHGADALQQITVSSAPLTQKVIDPTLSTVIDEVIGTRDAASGVAPKRSKKKKS